MTKESLRLCRKKKKFIGGLPIHYWIGISFLVSRVAGVPNGYFGFYSAGAKTAERVLQFSKVQERIIIKEVSCENIADITLPIYESVQANNFAPILAAFDQELYDADTGITIIELSDFFTEDIEAIS